MLPKLIVLNGRREIILIIDYGMGNLHSILHKLGKAGIQAIVSSKIEDIAQADKLILPGVGAFGAGMENLKARGLLSILNRKVLEEKTPILGICLGMQLFAKSSEEGDAEGLGWIDGEIKRFHFDLESEKNIRIPHVGWNTILPQKDSPILMDVALSQRFYFTHSYHIVANNPADVLATTCYGYEFVSAIQHGNIIGVQFHPEKSHRRGIIIYKNFVDDIR